MFKQVLTACAVCLLLTIASVSAQTRVVLDTGDPSERVCNPKSYTDLGNGIIRDNVTGLEWQKTTAPGHYDWQQAIDYCAGLTLGSHSDWRLPSIEELSTLVDAGRYIPAISTAYFPDTETSGFSSSTSCADYTDPFYADRAWDVHFGLGAVYNYGKSNAEHVRAVRGGSLQISNNFVDNGDGTITDTSTGLEWQKGNAPGTHTWYNATAYCAALYLGGHSDWRLPTRNELQSLVDYSRYNPATTFPNTVPSLYWSSTTTGDSTDDAWFVDFIYGYVDYCGGIGRKFLSC